MILYISITTLILAVVITLYNYQINKISLFLAGFLVPLSLTGILHYFSIFHDSPFELAFMYGHFIPIYFLSGPMLYFYVRGSLSDQSKLSPWDYLHFLPSVISLVSIFPYYFEDFDKKLAIAQIVFQNPALHKTINISWLYPSSFNILFRAIIMLFYISMCMVCLIQYQWKTKRNNVPAGQKYWTQIWLYSIVIIAGLTSISYFIITKNYYFANHGKTEINAYSINYFAALSYCLVPIVMLIFPQHIYGIPKQPKVLNQGAETIDPPQNLKKNDLVDFELLERNSNDPFIDVSKRVMAYLEKEKPFINPEFSIDDLAKNLDLQKHHLYYCFNSILQIKFTSLRTKLRVNHAKEILLSGDLTMMSMEGIWTKAGFSSRTNFFVSFKEETGLTPLEFIKNKNLGNLKEN